MRRPPSRGGFGVSTRRKRRLRPPLGYPGTRCPSVPRATARHASRRASHPPRRWRRPHRGRRCRSCASRRHRPRRRRSDHQCGHPCLPTRRRRTRRGHCHSDPRQHHRHRQGRRRRHGQDPPRNPWAGTRPPAHELSDRTPRDQNGHDRDDRHTPLPGRGVRTHQRPRTLPRPYTQTARPRLSSPERHRNRDDLADRPP